MKKISDADHALLIERLPAVLALAAAKAPPTDTRLTNQIRMLSMLVKKWQRIRDKHNINT